MKTQVIEMLANHATAKNVVMGNEPGPVISIDPTIRKVYLISEPAMAAGVFPYPGHVRSPDQYGPTGSDFTGNETLPDIADVKAGVDYGAGGTEFEGTYSGGGGGAARPIGSPIVRRVNP